MWFSQVKSLWGLRVTLPVDPGFTDKTYLLSFYVPRWLSSPSSRVFFAFRHFRGFSITRESGPSQSVFTTRIHRQARGSILESFASCLVLSLSYQIMALTRRTLRRAITRRPKRAPTRKSASRTKRVSLWRQVNYSDPSDPMTLRLSTARLTNSMNPFPPSMICDLQYVDYGTVSATAATTSTGAEYAFRLNSLFDPNLTGSGHQPRYFDQLTNIYQLYRVYKCSFQVEFYKPSSSTMYCAGQVRNSQDTYTLSTKSPVNVGEADGAWLQYARDDGTPLIFSELSRSPTRTASRTQLGLPTTTTQLPSPPIPTTARSFRSRQETKRPPLGRSQFISTSSLCTTASCGD